MKLIFNSDILYADSLISSSLPNQLSEFFNKCTEHTQEHEVIIPLTTLLEFDRKQKEFADKERKNLKNAKEEFSKYNIKYNDFDPNEKIQEPDLITLIKEMGIPCSVEEPNILDYQSAHEKACSKISPCPADQKSDEMRDLVIWEIANRIANENNGAILLSRDKIHTHHRGDEIAVKSNLLRCNSFERAYEALNIETVSAKKIKSLLEKIKQELIGSELPIHDNYQIISIEKVKFVNNENGITKASCNIKLNSGTGQEISAKMDIDFFKEESLYVSFSDIIVGKSESKDIVIELEKKDISNIKYQNSIKKLKRITKD